jgi:hypothetical protein
MIKIGSRKKVAIKKLMEMVATKMIVIESAAEYEVIIIVRGSDKDSSS